MNTFDKLVYIVGSFMGLATMTTGAVLLNELTIIIGMQLLILVEVKYG